MQLKYFNLSEFDSPDHEGSHVNMDTDFLQLLDKAREIAGIPFKITSGYRTKSYNESLQAKGYKASPNSSHIKGVAVDIAIQNGAERWLILNALIQVGIRRFGIAKGFLHADVDPDKSNAVWTY